MEYATEALSDEASEITPNDLAGIMAQLSRQKFDIFIMN